MSKFSYYFYTVYSYIFLMGTPFIPGSLHPEFLALLTKQPRTWLITGTRGFIGFKFLNPRRR